MKKVLYAAAMALAIVAAVAVSGGRNISRTEFMFNTVITLKAPDKGAVSACFDEIARLEKLLSVYEEESEISKINSAPSGTGVALSEETYNILKKAEEYKKLTRGAFDITLKPVADLWNVKGEGYVPCDEEINLALTKKGDLVFDDETSTVTLTKEGMSIDLGGIAKGYAAERVTGILKERGVKRAVVDMGGNIAVIGKNGNDLWKVGLQHPTMQRGETFALVFAENKFIVTSGGYERFFERDGNRYHHIFDPETGKNPETDILSATVISKDGTLADALSTAFFVMGKDRALSLAEDLGVEAVIYTETGVFHTPSTEIELTQ